MTLLNQKQAYMKKIINEAVGYVRETYLSNITKLNELIKQKRERLEEVKKLRQIQSI